MKINKIITTALIAMVLFSLFCLPALSLSAKNITDVITGLNQTADEAHITQDVTIFGITGKLIFLLLGILGSLFLLLVIYGGITWMTAAGNEEKITKARATVIHAIIGLAIVLAAYLLTNFVIFQLSDKLITGGTKSEDGSTAGDEACAAYNGICQNNATVGGVCAIGSVPGIWQTGKCLSNSSPTYLCCVPN